MALKDRGVLTPIQVDLLRLFASLPDQERFFLTGGTALAEFYLGHRLSFDLGFFTAEADLIVPFSHALETVCNKAGFQANVVRRFATFTEFLVARGGDSVRVDLAQDRPFRFALPLRSSHGVLVNDADDLYVDKLPALYGRSEPRDAVDLYFILQKEPAASLLPRAAEKDPGFDLYWFAVALNRCRSFPDELDRWPVKMLVHFDPKDLKGQFAELATDVMRDVASPPGPA